MPLLFDQLPCAAQQPYNRAANTTTAANWTTITSWTPSNQNTGAHVPAGEDADDPKGCEVAPRGGPNPLFCQHALDPFRPEADIFHDIFYDLSHFIVNPYTVQLCVAAFTSRPAITLATLLPGVWAAGKGKKKKEPVYMLFISLSDAPINPPDLRQNQGIFLFGEGRCEYSFLVGLHRRTMRQPTGAQGPSPSRAETSM